jgi:hypothetical protein
MWERPEAGTPVDVIVSVPGPTTGRLVLSVKWPETSRPPPVLTQSASSVYPDAIERTIWFGDEETTVVPGAAGPSHPLPTSQRPSIVGHVWAPADAARTPKATRATVARMKIRFDVFARTRDVVLRKMLPISTG